jgi:hypothetical protein
MHQPEPQLLAQGDLNGVRDRQTRVRGDPAQTRVHAVTQELAALRVRSNAHHQLLAEAL